MSKERAARIANSPDSSKRGAKSAGSGTKRRAASQGGTRFPSALSCDRFALASAGLCAQRERKSPALEAKPSVQGVFERV